MNSRISLPIVALILLASSACSASSDEDPEGDSNASDSCEKVLGKAGMKWVTDSAGDLKERDFKSSEKLQAVRFKFHRDAQERLEDRSTSGTACDINPLREGSFELGYAAAFFPFSDIKKHGAKGKGNTTRYYPVNSDVQLEHTILGADLPIDDSQRREVYGIYVRCTTAKSRHGDKQLLHGMMADKLTGDPSVRTHMRHLLHATQVMASSIDCQNGPNIPGEPPSSVK